MKVHIACLSVLTAIAVGSQLAAAADFGNVPPGGVVNGGIRDYGGAGGVPVPAPVPIPDYKPSFYFRIDAGYGIMSQPSVTESGYKYGDVMNGENAHATGSPLVLTPLSPNSSWFNTDFSDLATYGAGVGYYIGDGWRADATIEGRSKNELDIDGSASWTSYGYRDTDANPATPDVLTSDLDVNGTANDRTTTINVHDRTTLNGAVFMANLYYDLMTGHRFNPYVGAGLGVVWNDMQRKHTTLETSLPTGAPSGTTPTTEISSTTTTARAETASLAAAAMVGLTYQISDITSVDFGYRFLYLGGTGFDMTIDDTNSHVYNSHVSFGDQFVHQIRAGLRFDVN
jgi:opacity protein-like surface antigen